MPVLGRAFFRRPIAALVAAARVELEVRPLSILCSLALAVEHRPY